MASTLWLSVCLVLFVQNLMDLLSDRHQLSYKVVEEGDVLFDEVHDLNYLVCTPFKVIKHFDSLTYEPASQNVSVRSFLNHSIDSIEHRLKVTGLFHLNASFIFNEHVCFLTTKGELDNGEEKPFNRFLETYVIQSIFIYSKEKQPNFYERTYEKTNPLRSIYLRAYKQKVFGVNHLLNPDCSNRAHQIRYDRFSCLNRCFVKKKMSSGFYRFDDEGTFNLSEIQREKQIRKREVNEKEEALGVHENLPTPSAIEGAEDCLKRCPERACFWEVVISLKIDSDYHKKYLLSQKEVKENVRLQVNTYAAFYSMSDFYLQLFGLLILFTGTSVLRVLHALLSLTARKVEPLLKNGKLFRIIRPTIANLKRASNLLSLVFVLVQGLAMVNEFHFHSNYPNRTSTLNVSSEPFSVVICFPRYKEDGRNSLTLSELIEKHSEDLNDLIEDMEIHSSKRIKPEFKFSNEVFLKILKFNGQRRLSRCFRLDFDLDERHRKMPLAYLKIEFKTKEREIFLIERNQNFTSSLVNFRGLFYPQKVTKRYSKSSVKSNCRDYSEEESCGSRRNCLDRCLSTKFIEKHGSIPTNTVVSSSHLNSIWLKRSIYFNETVDPAIEEKCSADFNQTDCNEVHFEESPDLVNIEVEWSIRIRLSYMNIVEEEMEYDWAKTLLDIIGLETVLFGSNALGILTTVFFFLCRTLRLKWRKAYSVFLILLASAGFFVHNVLVFRAIINGDLQEDEFFEKPERYSLPSPIFCFPLRKEVDENHRVTGEYLDDLTDNLTFRHAFQGIHYNNRTHFNDLYIPLLNLTKRSSFYDSPELELSHFYYRGLKCLKTSLKVSYEEEDFLLLHDKTVLRIYLNYQFANEMKFMTFLHQQADSKEIGGGFGYPLVKRRETEDVHCMYSIQFELFRIVQEDQFEWLKDPRRLFRERLQVNDAKAGEAMRKQFEEEHNRTTDHLPLDGHFDLEMDNELYEQHAKTVTDQSAFHSLDFEQKVANAYTNVYSGKYTQPHVSFSFSFLMRRVVITNRVNYTKLVVSLLNTLSLWLDICVIDLGPWLYKMLALTLHLYLLLIKISNRLDRLRD